MSTNNTTINITVRDSVNALVVGADIAISVAGIAFALVTDATGSAVASLNISNITIATVTISAVGYLDFTTTYIVSPTNNVYTVLLSIDPTQINKNLQFIDINSSPISGLAVSINGQLIGQTNSNGQILIITSAGFITIQTSNPNFIPVSLSGTYTALSFPNQIVVKASVPIGQILTLQTLAFVTIGISGNGLSDSTTTDSTGLAATNISFVPGTYNITLVKAEFVSLNTTLTVLPNVTTYSLGSLQSLNPILPTALSAQSLSSATGSNTFGGKRKLGATNGGATIAATPSTSSTQVNTGATAELEYPAEWVYPNTGEGKYLTSSQARIYIGNLFVDEVDTLYSVYNNNRIPIYGYSSTNVDAFGQGRRLVQGQISINFVSEGYLFTVLNEFNKKAITSNQTPAQTQSAATASSLATLFQQQATLTTQQANGDNTATTTAQISSINSQIMMALSTAGPRTLTQVKQVLSNATTATSNQNAIQLDVPFDMVIQATGGGRTTTRTIKNCLLTNNEQVWDQSDNVIKDVYGFVAVEMI